MTTSTVMIRVRQAAAVLRLRRDLAAPMSSLQRLRAVGRINQINRQLNPNCPPISPNTTEHKQ